MAFILSVLGVVLVIEGLPYFAFPKKIKEWSLSIQELPERGLRIMGFIAMMAGLFLVYLSRRSF
jgi:hypothetical protein